MEFIAGLLVESWLNGIVSNNYRGPIITSFVMELFGERGLLITCGCICMLTGGFIGFRILARKVLPRH